MLSLPASPRYSRRSLGVNVVSRGYHYLLVGVVPVSLCAPPIATLAFQRIFRSSARQFPLGTATPSEVCGECHRAILREASEGFGADVDFREVVVSPGIYTVRARLIYDLNRYSDSRYTGDQTELDQVSLAIKIGP